MTFLMQCSVSSSSSYLRRDEASAARMSSDLDIELEDFAHHEDNTQDWRAFLEVARAQLSDKKEAERTDAVESAVQEDASSDLDIHNEFMELEEADKIAEEKTRRKFATMEAKN